MMGAGLGYPFRMRNEDTDQMVYGAGAFMYRRYLIAMGIPMEVMRRTPDNASKIGPMSGVWEPYQEGDLKWPYRDPGAWESDE